MKPSALHLLYLLALPTLAAPSAHGPTQKNKTSGGRDTRTAWIERCRDGDTCRVRTADGLWFNVRLSGIDAPELRRNRHGHDQPFAVDAREALNHLVAGKSLQLRQTDLDRYNRPVVELLHPDGTIANHLMVRQGLAKAYRGSAGSLERAPYLAAEAEAKSAGRGLWSKNSTH